MRKIPTFTSTGLLTIFLGFFLAYSIVCRWFGFFQKPLLEKLGLLAVLWIILSSGAWLILRLIQKNKNLLSMSKRNLFGIIAALAGSIITLWIFHWLPPAFPSTFQIEIIPDGRATLLSLKSDGRVLPDELFSAAPGWRLTDTGWTHTGPDHEPLQFNGALDAPFELTFVTGPDEGPAIVQIAGNSSILNLFSPMKDAFTHQPFFASFGSPTSIWVVWVGMLALSEWLLLAGLFYLVFWRWPAASTAFLFPAVFLLPYITTIAGHNVTLGNDFGPFYYVYKAYLLDFLSHGQFPLWSPSEAAGFPFFSNPLAQALYPPNLVLTFIYWINHGYTRLDHQVFTVLAFCWFSLGLFLWLRSLRVEKRFALFAALTMALSFKMTELLRFPNAAHEAAWYPWILLSLTNIFTAKSKKKAATWAAGLFGALVCLFTAGYPYYIYYFPFMAAPYLIFMLIPRVRVVLFGIPKPDWRRFITATAISTMLALLVCAPYLFHMGRTINQTAGRGGDDYEHATMYPFDFQDSIESLVYPPAARPEGWFYFGALGLVLITLYFTHPRNGTLGTANEISETRRAWPIKAALLGWLVFLGYLSYGDRSYIFLLFYNVLPGFSALRGWGRLSIALLPGLALLLAFALSDFESRLMLTSESKKRNLPLIWIPLALLATVSLAFQATTLSRGITDEYWEIYFIPRVGYLIQTVANTFRVSLMPIPEELSLWFSLAFILFGLAAVVLTLVVFLKSRFQPGSNSHWFMFIGFGVFSVVNLWFGGPWLWNNGFSPKEDRQPGNYQRMLSSSFSTPRKNENSTLTLSPSFSVGSPPKWHYGRYQDFYFGAESQLEARDNLMGVVDGQRFFYSSAIDYPTITDFLLDARKFDLNPIVHDYTGDYLLVEVTESQPGYFSFIDNWDEDWLAQVDGKPVKLERLFGVFKSVHLSPGRHEIMMAYCPLFFKWANPACGNFK